MEYELFFYSSSTFLNLSMGLGVRTAHLHYIDFKTKNSVVCVFLIMFWPDYLLDGILSFDVVLLLCKFQCVTLISMVFVGPMKIIIIIFKVIISLNFYERFRRGFCTH